MYTRLCHDRKFCSQPQVVLDKCFCVFSLHKPNAEEEKLVLALIKQEKSPLQPGTLQSEQDLIKT